MTKVSPLFLDRVAMDFLKVFLDRFGQAVDLADDLQVDVVFVELRGLGLEVMHQVLHQGIHLFLGPIPILDGKGIEREILDAQFAGGADDGARGLRSRPMAFDAGQVPLLGPAPVAVHDDGHMPRQGTPRLRAEVGNLADSSDLDGLVPLRADRSDPQFAPVRSAMALR